ncbi:MAG: hypothetical protein AAF600_17255 [Bacteroidota bacterium]
MEYKDIPEKSDNVEVSTFDHEHVLIHQRDIDRRLKVSSDTNTILTLVDGVNTIDEIANKYAIKTGNTVDAKLIHNILYEKLAPHGIIKSEAHDPQKKDYAKYLSLRIQLFKPHHVYKVSGLIRDLFTPRFFYVSLFTMLALIAAVQVYANSFHDFKNAITESFVYLLFIVNVFSLFLHELGHASACRKFGADHGGIGFGFYIFTPVLYADVTDAWKLHRRKRIIIDLAGLYMQATLNSFMLCLYLWLGNPAFLQISFISLFGMLFNLNPLFRRDGYWALSDAMNITNLKSKSTKKIKEALSFIWRRSKNPLQTRLDVFMLIYGVLDWAFIILIVGSILLNNPDSILFYPKNIVVSVQVVVGQEIHSFEELKSLLFPLILPTVFYIILLKYFIAFYKNRNPKPSSHAKV